MRQLQIVFLLLSITVVNHDAYGNSVILEQKRFEKCYALFVQTPLQDNHPLWQAIKNEQIDGTAACMNLLNKAKLSHTNGQLLIENDPESIAILKTFSNWHRGFFEESYELNPARYDTTPDVIDIYSHAHYYTAALFKEQLEYKSIVTTENALTSTRNSTVERVYSVVPLAKPNRFHSSGSSSVTAQDYYLKFWQGNLGNPSYFINSNFEPPLVQTGNITGISIPESTILSEGYGSYPFNGSGHDINQHFGGGILGSQSFLLSHIKTRNYLTDGAIKLHRIFGKNVLEHFLCKKAPYLRSIDVLSDVSVHSSIPFRRGISCMSCHTSQDRVASMTRNLLRIASNSMRKATRNNISFIADTINQKLPQTDIPMNQANSDFYKTKPDSKLIFRGHNGTKYEYPITNLQSLGQAIASTDDFYICGASKYYQQLTGIKVDLNDSGNINYNPLNDEALFYRNKVIALGLALKESQNAMQIIRQIIDSDEFLGVK